MKRKLTLLGLLVALACGLSFAARAAGDGFNDVVKAIEQFYHVKHQSVPFLARAGMKATRTAAKIKGGEWKKLAEAGSVRVVLFEDQGFNSGGQMASFKASLQKTLGAGWSALVQTLSPKDEQQTHIFVRAAGQTFQVLVIEIAPRDATVVQATVKPEVLAQLLKDPGEMGKTLTDEATTVDP
jgi:hypothetical protein